MAKTLKEFLEGSDERILLFTTKSSYDAEFFDHQFSSAPYRAKPTDLITLKNFRDVIIGNPFNERSFRNKTNTFGGIEIFNNGEFDSLVKHEWEGFEFKIYIGPVNGAFSDFFLINQGKIDKAPFADTSINFDLTDNYKKASFSLQDNHFSSGESVNKPKPLCYGYCENITPALVSTSKVDIGPDTRIINYYQVHDGEIEGDVFVYANGIGAASVTLSEFYSVGQFALTEQKTIGSEFLLEQTITCNAKGAKVDGAWISKPGEIAKELTRLKYEDDEINLVSFDQVDIDAPYEAGVYINSVTTLSAELEKILPKSRFGINKENKFYYSLESQVSETEDFTLNLFDLEEDEGINISEIIAPSWRVNLKGKKNWTIQSSLKDVPQPRNDFISNAYGYTGFEEDTVLRDSQKAPKPKNYECRLTQPLDIDSYAEFIHDLDSVRRIIYTAKAFSTPFQMDIGDVVRVYYDRYDMDDGVNMEIRRINESYLDDLVGIDLWQ